MQVPGSRSLTNRALVCAALGRGTSRIVDYLVSDDTEAMIEGLRRLGVHVDEQPEELVVEGTEGALAIPLHPIDCRASGTTMRFLTACSALATGRVVLDGTARMRERPIQDLADALEQLGVRVKTVAGCPPVTIHGGSLRGERVSVEAKDSSQFLSALLMVSPFVRGGLEIQTEKITSRPYVDMTLAVMSAFGVSVDEIAPGQFRIPPRQHYRSRTYKVEPDASSASYFFAAAAITEGRVRVDNLTAASSQADIRFIEVLERMGCGVERGSHWTTVQGPRYLHGADVDMNEMPDAALTLAPIAVLAQGRTSIRNVHNLRIKETDRMAALKSELEKLGATVTVNGSDIEIDPPQQVHPARIDPHDDHRIAMGFAVCGLKARGIVIENAECVEKTFPDFFERLASLGKTEA
jgi:3-phosphoshikimate 1-carboxyvinyltransferase